MSHIPIIIDGAEELVKISSDYGSVEANEAAGVYPPDQMDQITHAKAHILQKVDETCEKLKKARLEFEAKCNIPPPE